MNFTKKSQEPVVFRKLRKLSCECTKLTPASKMKYIKIKSNILNGKMADPKVYWTILNYFEGCIANGIFSDPWKWANVIPVHKKRIKKQCEKPGFELTYRNWGNKMHFLFFTIQFFPPT